MTDESKQLKAIAAINAAHYQARINATESVDGYDEAFVDALLSRLADPALVLVAKMVHAVIEARIVEQQKNHESLVAAMREIDSERRR